jgi:hypothetical protein
MLAKPYSDRYVVIVDGVSSGAYLAPAFRAHGLQCIHVTNRLLDSSAFTGSHHQPDYVESLEYYGDIDQLSRDLERYNVVSSVPGHETGVIVSDQIRRRLKLPHSNDLSLSEARRDKRVMIERLRDCGVCHAPFLSTSNLDDAVAFGEAHDWRIVAKPLRAAGTQGVNVCRSEAELRESLSQILHEKDLFGQVNTEVLLQKFLDGDEYMVNTISIDGVHTITEVWLTKKVPIERAPVYDYVELIEPADPIVNVLSTYLSEVLDALGFRHGPGHSEVIVTCDGPVLVETAPRLMGAQDPLTVVSCTSSNHALDTVKSYTNPVALSAALAQERPLFRYCLGVTLLNLRSGISTAPVDWSRFERLPNFMGLKKGVSLNAFIPATTNLITTAGGVYLAGDDRDSLWADYRTIRALEKENIYNVTAAPLV